MATKFASSAVRPDVSEQQWMVLFASAVFVVVVGVVGCNRGNNCGEVTGLVTYKGQPVSEGMLIFSNPVMGVFITAPLGNDGSYRVETAMGYGLRPGTYQVAIVPPSLELPIGLTKDPPRIRTCRNIPERYRNAETSGLTVVVTPQGTRLDVDMDPR